MLRDLGRRRQPGAIAAVGVLGHGIWTHHLLRALGGDEPDAVVKQKWITGESLRDYLNQAVPRFIRKNTNIKEHQQPYGLIGASGTFSLAQVRERAKPGNELRLQPDFAGEYFRGEEMRPFKSLPGFSPSKRHRVPDGVSDSADDWARRLLSDEIAEEVQTVYEHARDVLKLKSRDVDKQEGTGTGTVDTEFFRFSVEAGQSKKDHREMGGHGQNLGLDQNGYSSSLLMATMNQKSSLQKTAQSVSQVLMADMSQLFKGGRYRVIGVSSHPQPSIRGIA
jgi:hypothetical protein